MEAQLPSFPVLFAFIFFLSMVIKIIGKSKAKNSTLKLPPGPQKLPIIGNLHNLIGSAPHRSLRDLAKKYGSLMHLQLGEVSSVVVSSPQAAKEVMKTHDITFAHRPGFLAVGIITYDFKDIAFAPYGNYWRQVRKISAVELLNANRVKSFQSIRVEEVAHLIQKVFSHKGSPINLTKEVFSMVYSITSKAAFGEKCKDQEAFIANVVNVSKMTAGFHLADLYPSFELLPVICGLRSKVEKVHKEIDKILGNIINEHKHRKVMMDKTRDGAKEDLVDVLLRLQEHSDLDFPLTSDNIKAIILDIFAAGGDTSSTTIDWAMVEMIKNPMIMKEAQAEVRKVFNEKGNLNENNIQEMKFLKAVIKETLRLHPPVPLLLPRESRESCEINGYDIPIKTKIIVNAWALGRDPMYWSEAETFNPERFLGSPIDFKGSNFEFIPFGAGRRMCPGVSFALPNVELPLAQLLYHFDWKLANGLKEEDVDMTEDFGLAVKRKDDLVLIPTPCHPSSTQ